MFSVTLGNCHPQNCQAAAFLLAYHPELVMSELVGPGLPVCAKPAVVSHRGFVLCAGCAKAVRTLPPAAAGADAG